MLLAESGAVEPSHIGPFKLYAQDTAGMLLHDVLFAPFFAGAAGAGQSWHWDVYVSKNRLWPQFARFAAVLRGIDPVAEKFTPLQLSHPRLRIHVLRGERTTLVWCRDAGNTWQTELAQGRAPQPVEGVTLEGSALAGGRRIAAIKFFDPWKNEWSDAKLAGTDVRLPAFSRSLVIRIENGR